MSLTVTWLGHSTVVLDLDGTRFLTDPLLGRHAGILRRRGPAPAVSAWLGTDAVLLSHLHHDHAHLGSLRLLPRDVPIVTASQNARWLRKNGLPGVDVGEAGWVEVGSAGRVRVSLCHADHRSRPMPHRPNEANGHLLSSTSATVWVAGDTSLYPAMSALPDQAGGRVDLAVVPVSGWGPRLSPGHLGPVEAAEACARVGARYAVPVHWGTLCVPGGSRYPRGWMDSPGPEFARALGKLAPDCVPVVLRRGVPALLEM